MAASNRFCHQLGLVPSLQLESAVLNYSLYRPRRQLRSLGDFFCGISVCNKRNNLKLTLSEFYLVV